jgi:hypothetical protein
LFANYGGYRRGGCWGGKNLAVERFPIGRIEYSSMGEQESSRPEWVVAGGVEKHERSS